MRKSASVRDMNKTRQILWAIILLCTSCNVDAETGLILNLHLGSYHASNEGWWSKETGELEAYNEVNPGLGLALPLNKHFELRGGGYKNSHNANSFYIGGAMYTNSRRIFSAGIATGVVTGYDGHILNANYEYKKVQPFAMPMIMVNYNRVRTEIGYIPSLAEGMANTITFTTGVKF